MKKLFFFGAILFIAATIYGWNMPLSPGWTLEEKIDMAGVVFGFVIMVTGAMLENHKSVRHLRHYKVQR